MVKDVQNVYLKKCDTYDVVQLQQYFHEAFTQLLGDPGAILTNKRIFLKVNTVGAFAPDAAITTHPTFVQAMIRTLKTFSSDITVGDNPATKDSTVALRKSEIYDIVLKEGATVYSNKDTIFIYNKEGKHFNQFEVSASMMDCDILINLPKLKTHALTYMTCAQKNLFGIIPGLSKAKWHVKASSPAAFGEMINDLYQAILNHFQDKKIIHFCDGILGLEGEGPSTGGSPKQANAILASTDAVSLDYIAGKVIKADLNKLFISQIATKRKLGPEVKDIQILGDNLDTFSNIQFAMPKNTEGIPALKLLKIKGIRNILLEHPKINTDICIQCGECAKICASGPMTIKKGSYPTLQSNACIRCWCCQEVCPVNAITKTKRPLIGRLFFKTND